MFHLPSSPEKHQAIRYHRGDVSLCEWRYGSVKELPPPPKRRPFTWHTHISLTCPSVSTLTCPSVYNTIPWSCVEIKVTSTWLTRGASALPKILPSQTDDSSRNATREQTNPLTWYNHDSSTRERIIFTRANQIFHNVRPSYVMHAPCEGFLWDGLGEF